MVGADDTFLTTYNRKLLSVNLCLKREFPFTFKIASIAKPMIGADFLNKYGTLVDLSRKSFVDPLSNLKTQAEFQLSIIFRQPNYFQLVMIIHNYLKMSTH